MEGHRLEAAAMNRENRELGEKTTKLLEELSAVRKEASLATAIANETRTGSAAEARIGDEALRGLHEATQRSLLEVSHAYDEYRQQTESRLTELESLLAQSQAALDMARSQHAEAEATWSAERTAMQSRLEELAELEALLKENEGLRSQDLAHLHTLLTETQKHLEQEQAARRTAEEQLQGLQAELRAAQNQLDGLNTSLSRAQQSGSQRESELAERIKDAEATAQRARERATELEALLASRMEPSTPGTASTDEMVGYLRKQKDALQADLQSLQTENRRILAQLDQTRALLDESRARLEESQHQPAQLQSQLASAYQEFQSRIAALSALKETNVDLAAQVEALQSRLAAAEQAMAQASSETENAVGQLRQARAAESTHAEHLRILTEERDSWKARCMQGGASIMDEAERERLEQAVKEATEERDGLIERQTALEAKVKRILQQCQVFKTQGDEYKRKLEAIEAVGAAPSADTEQQIAALQAELAIVKETMTAAQQQRDELSARLAKYNLALQRLNLMKQEYEALQVEHAQLKASAGSVEEVKREHELHKTLVTKQWQARVERLQSQVETLQAQLASPAPQSQAVAHEAEPIAKRPREEVTTEPEPVAVSEPVPTTETVEVDVEMEEAMEDIEAHATSDVEEDQDNEMDFAPHDQDEHEEEDTEDEEEAEEEEQHPEPETHDEPMPAQVELVRLHDEPIKTTLILPSFVSEPTSLETPDVLHEQQQKQAVSKPTFSVKDFDIDNFLVDEVMMPDAPVTKTTVPAVKPAAISGPSRTINLPVATASAATSTFTPTPIQPPAPLATKGRIIDLSHTGKKPVPVPGGEQLATAAASASGAVARGGKLIRGGRKGKGKRGGSAS